MKGLFTCALIFAGPSLSQPVFSLKLENFEAWSNCCFFFFFFAQINVCFFPRQYFPIWPLLTAIICRYVLCSAMYFSLLFISACLFIYLWCLSRWCMILVFILFDDLQVVHQHLGCRDAWWHHGLCAHLHMSLKFSQQSVMTHIFLGFFLCLVVFFFFVNVCMNSSPGCAVF